MAFDTCRHGARALHTAIARRARLLSGRVPGLRAASTLCPTPPTARERLHAIRPPLLLAGLRLDPLPPAAITEQGPLPAARLLLLAHVAGPLPRGLLRPLLLCASDDLPRLYDAWES